MKKLLLGLILLVCACANKVTMEESEVLVEDAEVALLVYHPSTSGSSSLAPTFGGETIGFTIVSHPGSPERCGVVFQCQHGKFYIEKRELYQKLKVGQKVQITYKELYRVERDRKTQQIVSKRFIDFDFINATEIK